MPEPSPAAVSARMIQLSIGGFLAQAVHAAACFGIADELAAGPCTVEELATAVGADGSALYRLMRALATAEVFAELDGRRFALTPLGELFRSDVPGSMRNWALAIGRPLYRDAWTRLPNSVRTGRSAFETLHGRTLFEYFRDHSEDARVFDAMMAASAGGLIAPVVGAYDFDQVATIVDVGGGRGALLSAILTANPRMRGVLFDLPHVIAGAGPLLAASGLDDRCRCVSGDFFDSVPSGGDVYLLSHVIHDWDDDRATRILANCRSAMGDAGRVLLAEWMLSDELGGEDSALAAWTDLTMLVMTPGGRQRTQTDFDLLLGRAGLRLSRIISTESACSLLEAVPA
jgi:hypothetical protein